LIVHPLFFVTVAAFAAVVLFTKTRYFEGKSNCKQWHKEVNIYSVRFGSWS